MNARSSHPHFDGGDHGQGEEEGLDLDAIRDWIGFVWRSRQRQPKVAIGVFAVIAGLGLIISFTMPRIYNSQVKLLVQPDLVGPALSNPGRAVPQQDNPLANVADTIMRRDNLVALVKETNLVDRWASTRPPTLRFKDKVMEAISGPLSEKERLTSLAQTLEQRLTVTTTPPTLTISVDWQDPTMAYELVTLVQKNFIESRYDADVTAIEDAIRVLEDHIKSEGEQVDKDLAAYQASIDAQGGGAVEPPPPPPSSGSAGPSPAAPSPALAPRIARPVASAGGSDVDLTKALEEKRRQIRVLQDSHDRELEALKQQLVQAQLTLAAAHPTVIALQQKIDTMSQPSPDLTVLKGEERALLAQIALASLSSGTPSLPGIPGVAAAPARSPSAAAAAKFPLEDPRTGAARARLEATMRRYQDVIARLDSARLELDITRTAYRYRYSVVTPAEVPRGPKKRTPQIIGIASLLAGALLALLAAAAVDFRSGRILETWQVRRLLGVEVVGELDPPR
jgi:uncharacterized protein involved in exopolysaccharide biosynthesis